MWKNAVSALTALALTFAATSPTLAFERFNGLAADRSITAGVRLTLPFGPRTIAEKPAWVGFNLTATRNFDGTVGYLDNTYYKINLAEVRFDQDQITTFRLGNLTTLKLDADGNAIRDARKLGFLGNVDNGSTFLWVALLAGAGLTAFLIIDDGSNSEKKPD